MAHYLIDPPEGWKFGFPKRWNGQLADLDYDSWLLANGYPAEYVARYPGGRSCRWIGPFQNDDISTFLERVGLRNGKAAQALLDSGRSVSYREHDTPAGHVLLKHPDGRIELVKVDL
jgi:hypothetical protein